jgi:CTP:molybdopterin cytidylyltransferase MocA
MAHEIATVDAVVLAGRQNTARLKDASPEGWEALIPIGGRPMLAWVLDALLGSRRVAQIALVAPGQFEPTFGGPRVKLVEPKEGMVENALAGARDPGPSEFLLIATSDIPFITPEIVDRFIQLCSEKSGDFYYPVCSKEATERRFPGVKRTYATIREGTFTGGNMVLIRRSKVESIADQAGMWVQNRKSPIKQAGLLGWPFVVKLLLGTLTIPELERTISRYFGLEARAVICPDPEVGTDVDKPSDLELARRELKRPA